MDINDLERIAADQENRLKEQAQTIAEFLALADRAILLESQVLDQQQLIAELQARLDKVIQPSAFDELAKGWMKSSIGKRANDNPKVDLTGLNLGVTRNNIELIKIAYANILETLKADGQAATKAEQQEIGILLKTLGFA